MKTTRIPHAPGTPLPELAEFLAPFRVHFHRSEGPQALERYLTGLLTEHPNKNCDTIAQVVPGTSEQRLQGLLTAIDWDEDDLNRQRVQDMLRLPTEGDGVLIFDDTGFAKQGRCSVGVARQYSGTLGRLATARSRSTATTPSAPSPGRSPREGQRARGGHLPDQAADRPGSSRPGPGVGCALRLCDCGRRLRRQPQLPGWLGEASQALRGRCPRRLRRGPVAARRADATGRCPGGGAGGAVVALGDLAGGEPGLDARAVCRVAWAGRVTSSGHRRSGWLIGEDASDGKRRYYWSNFGPEVVLERMVEYAHRRHWVEQYHEQAKGLLGWDQYQGRLWPGFHRHAVSVMLAYSFLVWQEWQQRQERARSGRPRRPFSPRPDRRRMSLPEVHRQVCDWLRLEAAKELLA